jgi:glycosyltransferase involved in cell wall biosynthesis
LSGAAPELAVIVIGYRAPREMAEAVSSLLEQEIPLEIVAVNSGGGNAAGLLRAAGLDVPVVEVEQRLFAGAARNRGIAATHAPFVAFLAADCMAAPGWANARLLRHRAGDRAVASAMINSHPRNLVACAAHLVLFMRRLPGLPEEKALRYGASFDRRLFDEYGLFNETLRIGEDTDFLERLPAELKPVWEPRVQTIHRNETRLLPMLADQYRRGLRSGQHTARTHGKPPRWHFLSPLHDRRPARKLAKIGLAGRDKTFALLARPIVWLALMSKAAGLYVGGRRKGGRKGHRLVA